MATATRPDRPTQSGANAPQGIQSVEIGHRVLRELANFEYEASLGELAKALDMAPSKVHRYLTSLIRCDLVVQQDANGNYGLGPALIPLGFKALRGADHHDLANQELRCLGAAVDQTTFVSVWSDQGPVVTAWHDSGRPVAIVARPGGRLSPTRSGTGRVFLAYRDDQAARRYFKRERGAARPTQDGKPLSEAAFMRLLTQIRARGMARVRGDLVRGVDALSAPALDATGDVVLTLTIVASHGALDCRWEGDPARALAAAVNRLSYRFGAAV